MKKLVVFDLDGTLYNAGTSFVSAVKRFLAEYNLFIPPDNFITSFIGEPDHVFFDWLKSLSINETEEIIEKKFSTYEIEGIEKSGKLFNSVIQVFDWLKLNGYEIGLCTNATEEYLNKVIDKFAMRKYFSVIKFPLSKDETKSKMLGFIKQEFLPDFAYMVGDRFHDFQAANENSFTSIAVTYGYGKDEIYQAEYQINDLWALEEIL